MKIFGRETREARADLIAARQDLDAVEATLEETDEYIAANQAVVAAEDDLRWWQQIDIAFGCYPKPEPGHVRGIRPAEVIDEPDAARRRADADFDEDVAG